MTDTKLEEDLNLDGRLLLIKRIGRGGQAQVWKVRELDGAKRELAAKLVVIEKEKRHAISEEVIDGEIQKLRLLNSNFVVTMYYAVYVLMEDTGDLVVGYTMPLAIGTLESEDAYCSELRADKNELFDKMWSIGQGIASIHHQGLVHGDIKLANVHVFKERDLTWIRVSDLGAAYLAGLGFGVAFDHRYAAPERFGERYETATKYDKKKSDIYSLGLLYFELITGRYPYGDNLHFEFPMQDYHRVHANHEPNWELIPKIYSGLLETLKRMVDKDPEKRPEIGEVLRKLDFTRSVVQMETTRGHRRPEIFFPPNMFIWNPRLHKKFKFHKKVYFIRSSRPFDLAPALKALLRKEFPKLGATLYVAFGTADIIVTSWERENDKALANAMGPLIKLTQGKLETYEAKNIVYKDSKEQEKWDNEPDTDLAKRIAAYTVPQIEKALPNGTGIEDALEPWLKKERLILNKLLPVTEHGMVRLMFKVEAAKPMDQEHDGVVESMLKFLKAHYAEAGGKLPSYPYRVYRDVTVSDSSWGTVKNKFLFAELFGRNIYNCATAVLGLITAIGSVSASFEQHFLFSSHIQFDYENLLESEDGALAEILSNAVQ